MWQDSLVTVGRRRTVNIYTKAIPPSSDLAWNSPSRLQCFISVWKHHLEPSEMFIRGRHGDYWRTAWVTCLLEPSGMWWLSSGQSKDTEVKDLLRLILLLPLPLSAVDQSGYCTSNIDNIESINQQRLILRSSSSSLWCSG